MDGLVAMQHAFGTEGFDPQIRPDLIPLPIGQALFHQVLRKGYSIICVLDGLDQLESSTHHRRRFMQLFDSAINLTNSQGNLGIAIVSVTRTNTYNSFPDITLKPNQYISGETIVKQILPIDFNAIVQRRIEFLRDNVPMLAKGGTGWSLNDWPSHLDKFLEFLKSSQQDAHIENPMYAFGDNRRAQMQVVQLQYFDFLRQEGTQSYLFLESLVLAGQRFPPRNYRHTLTSKGNWRSEFIGTTAFDNHLLPSVFTFPYIEFESLGGHPHQIPNSEGVLLGIRVLQILAANESLVKDLLSNRSHITAKAMSDILFTLFSYPRELTMTLINQFAENEFLGLGGLDFPLYLEPTRQCLYMMPKSVYTLRQFLYDIAYLNLCTMRVPLAFRKDKRTPNFFIQACLDEAINPTINWDLNVSESLVQWAAAKIINSCSMFRLLSRINKVQKQRYRNQLQFLDQQQKQIAMHAERGQEGIFDGMFKFPEKMHIQLLQQIDAMVRSIEEDDPRATEVILRLVEDYWSYWGTK